MKSRIVHFSLNHKSEKNCTHRVSKTRYLHLVHRVVTFHLALIPLISELSHFLHVKRWKHAPFYQLLWVYFWWFLYVRPQSLLKWKKTRLKIKPCLKSANSISKQNSNPAPGSLRFNSWYMHKIDPKKPNIWFRTLISCFNTNSIH